jgi:hypothetical protein
MSQVAQQIAAVRSLRRDLRDVRLSVDLAKTVEKVQESLRSFTGNSTNQENGGWRRVGGAHNGSNYRAFGNGNNGSGGGGPRHNGQLMNRGGNSASGVSSTPYRPIPKYVSKFKSASVKIDDAIINTIILGKLNKFSPQNYDEIMSFLCQILDSGQTDFLKDFMDLVFQKATSEEIFCALYARLLSELSSKYKFLISEMVVLYKEYMTIFEDLSIDNGDSGTASYDEFVARNSRKKYRLGYSQFLAELIKNRVIDRDLLIKTVYTIASQIPIVAQSNEHSELAEEYADCLLKIIRAICDMELIAGFRVDIGERLRPFTEKKPGNNLTMKARFAILDIVEKICCK